MKTFNIIINRIIVRSTIDSRQLKYNLDLYLGFRKCSSIIIYKTFVKIATTCVHLSLKYRHKL